MQIELEQAISRSTGNKVIAICGNNVPIVTESAVEIDKPNMPGCLLFRTWQVPHQKSRRNQNLHVTYYGDNFTLKSMNFVDGDYNRYGGNVEIGGGGHHQIIGCEFRYGQVQYCSVVIYM
jgi:hypothetical protein